MHCFSGYSLTMVVSLSRAGGNSWSTGRAPPPPPGVSSKNPHGSRSKSNGEKGGGKSGLSGLAIAGIVFGILLALAIVIALFSKRSSPPPSYYLDEEGFSNQKSSTPMVSRELSGDKHPTNYTGNFHLQLSSFFWGTLSELSLKCSGL